MALLKRKRIGVHDAMEVVTRFVNACNRHDADGVASCLHADFDSIQPMYPARNFRGADQVRRNWQAIFDAEPGFRLTVLRSAVMDDTVWLELHGAGDEAEVAGIFIMGIVGDRIRWARIYSALVEPVPAGVGEPPPPLREVPRHDGASAATAVADGEGGELVEQELIAPVLDMERSTRRRRRRRDEAGASPGEPADEAADAADDPDVDADAAVEEVAAVDVADAEPAGVAGVMESDVAGDAESVAAVVAGAEAEASAEGEAVAVVGTDGEVEAVAVAVVETEPEPEPEAEPVAVAAPAPVVDGLGTESVPVIVWDDAPVTEVAEAAEAADDDAPEAPVTNEPAGPTRRLFGKRPKNS